MVVIQVRAALLRLMWAQLGSQSPPTATFPRDGFCFLRSFARYCAGRGGDSGGFGYGVRFPLLHLHVYVLFVHRCSAGHMRIGLSLLETLWGFQRKEKTERNDDEKVTTTPASATASGRLTINLSNRPEATDTALQASTCTGWGGRRQHDSTCACTAGCAPALLVDGLARSTIFHPSGRYVTIQIIYSSTW